MKGNTEGIKWEQEGDWGKFKKIFDGQNTESDEDKISLEGGKAELGSVQHRGM